MCCRTFTLFAATNEGGELLTSHVTLSCVQNFVGDGHGTGEK